MSKKRQPRIKHVPQRTCVICREKKDKRQLTRIVRTEDAGVVVDPTGKRNGRGAYLCEQLACWDKALSGSRLLGQALAADVSEAELAEIAAFRPSGNVP